MTVIKDSSARGLTGDAKSAVPTGMRIAHLSDPHLLDLAGVDNARLFRSKRLTGYLTLKLHRQTAHQGHVVGAMVEDINRGGFDHVVITGDVTNLSLEPEFALARRVFDRFEHGPKGVTVIPGNHDVYTRGAERTQRFAKYFGEHITSDVPLPAGAHPSGPFPFVRLRGPLAIVGLSTAVARLPLIAAGRAGEAQLEALELLLDHPEVRRRTPVVLVHHPLVNPPGWLATPTHGLVEGKKIRALLGRAMGTGLVLHGHLHDRWHRELRTRAGATIHHIGATSASLVHKSPARMAGYNVYEFDRDGGFASASARIWDPAQGGFVRAPIGTKRALAV